MNTRPLELSSVPRDGVLNGEDAPPGFGVRFSDVSAEARQLVQAYSEAREPMLHDD